MLGMKRRSRTAGWADDTRLFDTPGEPRPPRRLALVGAPEPPVPVALPPLPAPAPRPQYIQVDVTKDHITQGKARDIHSGALALALRDLFPGAHVDVAGFTAALSGNGQFFMLRFGPEAGWFCRDINGSAEEGGAVIWPPEPVDPCSFTAMVVEGRRPA